MTSQYSQSGIGLVEVMVAVLLMAVAVLGFSALQINALKATNESLDRSRSMSISKQLLEDMRLNSLATSEFTKEFNKLNADAKNVTKFCNKVVQSASNINQKNCISDVCTPTEIAALSAWRAANLACEQDIMINMMACPDMSNLNTRQCIISSWGETLPILGDDKQACGNSNGTYKIGANCLILEAY